MSPREAFVTMCFIMASADEELHPKEIDKIEEVLLRYGFTDEEMDKVLLRIANVTSLREGFDLGVEANLQINKMDGQMQQNLLQALREIAEADGRIHPMENILIESVQFAIERTSSY